MRAAKPLQRLGALGDIHTEDERLALALRFLQQSSLDAILAVGDISSGQGKLDICCALLQEAGVLTVRGNHDRWLLGRLGRQATSTPTINEVTQSFLESLPRTLSLLTSAGRLLLCHGLGEDDMALVMPDDSEEIIEVNEALQGIVRSQEYSFLVSGHSHRRMVRSVGPLTLINAGTLHREHQPCFLIADFIAKKVEFYNLPDAQTIEPAEVFSLTAPCL